MAKRKPDIPGAVQALDEWLAKHPHTAAQERALQRQRAKREAKRRRDQIELWRALQEPVTI